MQATEVLESQNLSVDGKDGRHLVLHGLEMIHEIIEPAVVAFVDIGPLAGQLSTAACLVMADLDGYPISQASSI